MLTVSRSGPAGKLREFLALRKCLNIEKAPDEVRDNQLIIAILAEQSSRNRELTDSLSARGDPVRVLRDVLVARMRMLGHSEEVAAVLADRSPYNEARAVKRWLMWIAQRVARASGDRWLGMGQKISDAENAMLDRLGASLGTVTIVEALPSTELEVRLGTPGQWGDSSAGSGDDERGTSEAHHWDMDDQ
jgi:hypothetical protein